MTKFDDMLAEQAAEHAAERDRCRERLEALGLPQAEIDQILACALTLHEGQLARFERNVLLELRVIDLH